VLLFPHRLAGSDGGGSNNSSSTGYLSSGGSSCGLYSEEEDDGEGEGQQMSMRALLRALPGGSPSGFWTGDRLQLFQVGGRRAGAADWVSLHSGMQCSPGGTLPLYLLLATLCYIAVPSTDRACRRSTGGCPASPRTSGWAGRAAGRRAAGANCSCETASVNVAPLPVCSANICLPCPAV
jgi:hypothetical protein